ncbi:DUF998 domain-containing protein [Mycobacterium sp.]|uniref:DUF998 domain-containing protein n=1 Tax=Mycobacterium sp. TaxID=1785 RepID=UPI003D0C7F6F
MTHSRRAAVAWLSAGLSYLTLEAVAAGAFQPTYSYAHNFISDLGVPLHSPLAWLMNTAFAVQGTLFLAGAILSRGPRPFLAFAAANAVGNVLIALFHSGSAAHAVGAVLAIVGGNAAILAASSMIGGRHRGVSLTLGGFGLVSFAVFVFALQNPGLGPLGVWERCSVYSITAWELVTGGWLLSRRPTPSPHRARQA